MNQWTDCCQSESDCVHRECLNRLWMAFVLSHRAGPLILTLTHLITDEPEWKCSRLLCCWWKHICHTFSHFLCTAKDTLSRVSISLSLTCFLIFCFCLLPLMRVKVAFISGNTLLLVFSVAHPYKTHKGSPFFWFKNMSCLWNKCCLYSWTVFEEYTKFGI